MYFPLSLMQSGRKRSAHSRRQFIQCFLTGAAFRQRPLSRLLINFLAGTRTLPPEEPAPKALVRVRVYGQHFALGQHRTIWQADSARDFSSSQGLKSEGILYVFRTFQTAELAEKIRRSAQT